MQLLLLCASLFMGLPGSGAEHTILVREHHSLDSLEEVQKSSEGRLVAVDQEGDRLCHLRGCFTQFPGNRALAEIGDLELTRQVGKALSQELRAAGVNTLLGPVLDLAATNPVIGTRAFGADPYTVVNHAQALLEGLSPLLTVGKHFPGHGATAIDSHHALPLITLQEEHLHPFLELCPQLPLLMVGHFEIPDLPLSALIERLRSEWGYTGVIVSDDLTMEALSGSLADRAVQAFLAGCDLLIISHTADLRPIIAEFAERVPPERIAESLARLERLQLPPATQFESHQALAREVAERALTPGPLPRINGRVKVIVPNEVREQVAEGIAPFPQVSFDWEEPDLVVHMVLRDQEEPQGVLVCLGDPQIFPEAPYCTYSPVPAAIEALFREFEVVD